MSLHPSKVPSLSGCGQRSSGPIVIRTSFTREVDMAVGVPVLQMARVGQNYLAIGVAAIACFLLEAGWYSAFMNTWLNGIGRSMQWLVSSGMNPYLQYAT